MNNMSLMVLGFSLLNTPIFTFAFEECPFCLEKMLPTQYMKTCCGHEFHIKCLYKMVLAQTQNCPVCRKLFTLHCHEHFYDHSMCCTDLVSSYPIIINEEQKKSFRKEINSFFIFERDRLFQKRIDVKNEQITSFLYSELLNILPNLGEHNQSIYDETILEMASQLIEQIQNQKNGSGISLFFSLHLLDQPNLYIQLYPVGDGNLDIYIQIESGFEDFIKSNGVSYIRSIAYILASEFFKQYPSLWHLNLEGFVS